MTCPEQESGTFHTRVSPGVSSRNLWNTSGALGVAPFLSRWQYDSSQEECISLLSRDTYRQGAASQAHRGMSAQRTWVYYFVGAGVRFLLRPSLLTEAVFLVLGWDLERVTQTLLIQLWYLMVDTFRNWSGLSYIRASRQQTKLKRTAHPMS